MSSLIQISRKLPTIPIQLPPLEGENLNHGALIIRDEYNDAEDAIFSFRQKRAPEKLDWYRRYYLKPHMRGGRFQGRYSIRYVWNLNDRKTDRTVGVMHGENLSAAKILIGNQAAGAWMTPIRWDLCEDRDGEEPIDIGRFDPWSLLQGTTTSDIERLAHERGLVPDIPNWDFDQHYYTRSCPKCSTNVSVLSLAYNIDSAQCVECGVRPFLSRALGRYFSKVLPSFTNDEEAHIDLDKALLHSVGWMGSVNASTENLHQEELPEDITPHSLMKKLFAESKLLVVESDGSVNLPQVVFEKYLNQSGGTETLAVAKSVANALSVVIEQGGPFTETHMHMTNVLRSMAS